MSQDSDNRHPPTHLLLLYFAAYILSATFFQLRSTTPPGNEGAPIEYFTGALLWMLSLISLLMASDSTAKGWRSWLWLTASAGLALLALDELFALHEHTTELVGNDDHIKVLEWFVAGGVLYIIDRFEYASSRTRIALIVGYLIHLLYVLADIGDGDYFSMPFISISQLRWVEEYLELFALTSYLIGFLLLHIGARMNIKDRPRAR